MSTILDTIADYARLRVAQDVQSHSLDDLKALCRQAGPGNGTAFERALAKNGMSFICEVKKASPSKGIIAENFPYLDIALAYADAGADCISCLTEPRWFLGSDAVSYTHLQGSRFIRLLRNTRRFHGKSPLNIRLSGIAHACPPVPTLRRDSRICFFQADGKSSRFLEPERKIIVRRVVVTGLGAVTPVGNNVHDTWSNLLAGCLLYTSRCV